MTITDVAGLLEESESTVRYWVSKEALPSSRPQGLPKAPHRIHPRDFISFARSLGLKDDEIENLERKMNTLLDRPRVRRRNRFTPASDGPRA